jgi:hypothetical protein
VHSRSAVGLFSDSRNRETAPVAVAALAPTRRSRFLSRAAIRQAAFFRPGGLGWRLINWRLKVIGVVDRGGFIQVDIVKIDADVERIYVDRAGNRQKNDNTTASSFLS